MIPIAWVSSLPVPSPNWLKPPQPSPATLTRSPVRPSVVYSIDHPCLLSLLQPTWPSAQCKPCAAGRVHRQKAIAWLSSRHEHPHRHRNQKPAVEAERPRLEG